MKDGNRFAALLPLPNGRLALPEPDRAILLALLRDRCPKTRCLQLLAPFGGFLGLSPLIIEPDDPLASLLHGNRHRQPCAMNVSLAADNGGVPGTTLGTALLSGFPSGGAAEQGTMVSGPTLTAGTMYWAVVSAQDPINGWLDWYRTPRACRSLWMRTA